MALVLKVSSGGSVPPASYVAKFDRVEHCETEHGAGLRWCFTVAAGQYTGYRVNGLTGTDPRPTNKAGRFLAGVAGQALVVGADVDAELYVGQNRLIVVESTAN